MAPTDSRPDLVSKLKGFAARNDTIADVREAKRQLSEFAKRFPLRTRPSSIEDLKASDVYEKGSKDSFFYWVQFGTSYVGGIKVWASTLENAKTKLDELGKLLKTAADDSLSLHEKVDAPWDGIKGFGADRHIAKKIITLLYPEKTLGVFSTPHFEHFASKLGLDPNLATRELFREDYESSTVGEKFEGFNHLFFKWRNEHAPEVDILALKAFLYTEFPVPAPETVPERAGVLGVTGLLFEPENEMGVVSMFSEYHHKLGFPFIVKIQNGFPDATVIDSEGQPVAIEFEHKASNFILHGHPLGICDLVVCWENDLGSRTIEPDILALKDRIKEIIRNRFKEEESHTK